MIDIGKQIALSSAEMIRREKHLARKLRRECGTYPRDKRQASLRELELHSVIFLLSLHHFGVDPSIPRDELLRVGCERALDFFAGDWWHTHERDRERLLREPGNAELQWLDPFRNALLIALLARDIELLDTLAAWPSSWMEAEERVIPFPVGIEQVYFAMLNFSCPNKHEVSEDRIDNRRILALLGAIQSNNEGERTKLLAEALGEFLKGIGNSKVLPYEAIAIEESCLLEMLALYRPESYPDPAVEEFHSVLLLSRGTVQ